MKQLDSTISVIVPVYNVIDFLRRCLDSILVQTYRNLEIIIIDDGSDDGSGEICDQYAKRDRRIRVWHKENEGLPTAWNLGINKSSGEYIMFVDSDDWIEPDACLVAINRIKQTKSDMVVFGVYSDEKPNVLTAEKIGTVDKKRLHMAILSCNTKSYSDKGYYIDAVWGKIYKASLIKGNELHFCVELRRSQDAVFSLYTTEFSEKIVFEKERIYHHTFNPNSTTNAFSRKSVDIISPLLNENEKFINEYHKDDSDYLAANALCIFPRLIEADRNYFLNKNNPKQFTELYAEYRNILNDPIIKQYINRLDNHSLSFHQKLKVMLYRHPTLLLYRLYASSVKR